MTEGPTCGACGEVMTPENFRVNPEYFLCDSCSRPPMPEVCHECGGTGGVDSGGVTPWGAPITLPCPSCKSHIDETVKRIGASWLKDSSLEKWFPLTAEELVRLKEALYRIANYPVHSEPVGGAYAMQDIAAKALGIFPKI